MSLLKTVLRIRLIQQSRDISSWEIIGQQKKRSLASYFDYLFINITVIMKEFTSDLTNEPSRQPLFTIIHFNDVYDIQTKKNGTCGIVNFEAYIRELKSQYPNAVTLFSGDAFSPSALSNIYEGKQMVKCLNMLGIDAACYGNHEFDLDEDVTLDLAKTCNFPWLLGNIKYEGSNFLLGDGQKYIIKELECGLKLGIFGVAGSDWLGILGDQYEDMLVYEDFDKFSKQMTEILRNEHKCDMVIALTHMRVPEDEKLPVEVPDVDLVLGGHDHIIYQKMINNVLVVKSGDNFKTIRTIHIYPKNSEQKQNIYAGHHFAFETTLYNIPITENPNLQLEAYVNQCMQEYTKHDRVVGWTDVELQTRFKYIRTRETNYGNFLADLVRYFYNNQIVILNSGGTRIDALVKPGPLRFSTVSNIINDILVVKMVPGRILLQALQYSCSSCPDTYAGSFLLISGISYSFDYRKNPRVQEVLVHGEPLDLDRSYSVATHSYMANGGDGFGMLKPCPFQIDPLASIDMLSLLLKFFKTGETVQNDPDLQANIELMHIRSNDGPGEQKSEQKTEQLPQLVLSKKPSQRISRISKLRKRVIMTEDNKKFSSIAPVLDGRIKSLYP